MNIEFFTNDRYKVLECMCQRQIDISGNQCVPLSQRQIAEMTGVAYKTVNNIIKALKDNGYILHEGKTRGKYALTDKAKTVFANMQNKEVQR